MASVGAGEVKVPDVMFPGGSPELVEPIYKNPKLSAPFNEQLTAIICDYVRHRLPSLVSRREGANRAALLGSAHVL